MGLQVAPHPSGKTERNRHMNYENRSINKWKKAIFGTALGSILSAVLAVVLYLISRQPLYLAIIGLGAGIGFSIGGGLDQNF
jgi:riboflavin transporter FmnP